MNNFLIPIILIISCSCFSQKTENKITWEEERRLNWEDFNAKPNPESHFEAVTHSGFAFSWSLSSSEFENEFKYEVKSYFQPDKSWVKAGSESDYLLAHEQLHFDISELFARKFRELMAEIKIDKNLKSKIQVLYQKNETNRRSMQERFDLESQHGKNTVAEEKWQKFIKIELEKTKPFHS